MGSFKDSATLSLMYLKFYGSTLKKIAYKNRQNVSQGICNAEYCRAVWVICVTTAMFLFVYQVADRTSVYFRYNTTVSVNIRYIKSVPFPAVTLCNINTFRYHFSYHSSTKYHGRLCACLSTRASGPRSFPGRVPKSCSKSCPWPCLEWGGTLVLS